MENSHWHYYGWSPSAVLSYLPEPCINPPIAPTYNMTACEFTDTCHELPRRSVCHNALYEMGSNRLFKSLSATYLNGLDNVSQTEQRIQNRYRDVPRHDASTLDCACTRLDGNGGRAELQEEHAYYYTITLAVVLSLAAVAVVALSNVTTEKFGTLGYFLAISRARTSRLYYVFIGGAAVTMAIAMVHLLIRVENQRQDGHLTSMQYSAMYESLFVGFLLNIFALQKLLCEPSDAIVFFLEKFKVASTNTREVLVPEKEGQATIPLVDVLSKWFFVDTSTSVLNDVADACLFYYMGSQFQDASQLEDGDEAKAALGPSVLRATSHCEHVATKETDGAATTQPGEMHERLLAQSMNRRYWKGALHLIRRDEFSPATSSSDTPSISTARQELQAIFSRQGLELPPHLELLLCDHLAHASNLASNAKKANKDNVLFPRVQGAEDQSMLPPSAATIVQTMATPTETTITVNRSRNAVHPLVAKQLPPV